MDARSRLLSDEGSAGEESTAPGHVQASRAVHADEGEVSVETGGESGVSSSREGMSNLTSNIETMMHLLKGNIGTGMLAMPFAFQKAGLWVGFIGVFFIAFVTIHCMHLLLASCHCLCRRLGVPYLDYGGVIEGAFKTGPQRVRCLGPALTKICNFFLCLTLMGFCSVYFVFISKNIEKVVDYYVKDDIFGLRGYITLLLPLFIVYCFIRNLDTLAPLSTIANFVFAVGLVIIFIHTLHDLPDISERPFFTSVKGLPIYFGTAIYAFEGIGIVLPLENKMRHPEDFIGMTGVLNTGMVVVTVLYASVGFYGYLKFGEDTLGSITLNMPQEQPLFQAVMIMFAAGMFHSFALQFYVPVLILFPSVQARVSSWPCVTKHHLLARWWANYGEYFFRAFLVSVTYGFAMLLGENLGLFISLVGALASSSLALMYPPLIDSLVFWNELGPFRWRLLKNLAIAMFGVLGFFTGTYVTLREIVVDFTDSKSPAANATLPDLSHSSRPVSWT